MNIPLLSVALTAVLVILIPFFSILWRSKRDKKTLAKSTQESYERGLKEGRAAALAEVEQIKESRSVSYREAAMIAGNKCASCGRGCIHCAREAKESTSKVKVSPVSKQLLEAGRVRFEEDLVMPEESALLWGEKKKERTV